MSLASLRFEACTFEWKSIVLPQQHPTPFEVEYLNLRVRRQISIACCLYYQKDLRETERIFW
jgi:hypothetical protein